MVGTVKGSILFTYILGYIYEKVLNFSQISLVSVMSLLFSESVIVSLFWVPLFVRKGRMVG